MSSTPGTRRAHGSRPHRWRRAAVLCAVAALTVAAGSAPALATGWSSVDGDVDAMLQPVSGGGLGAPGVGLVVTQGATQVYSHTNGTMSTVPTAPGYPSPPANWDVSYPIPVASNTKLATATAVMRLVQNHPSIGGGKTLSLATKVVDVIPDFDQYDAAKADITVQMLLNMTSGLMRDSSFSVWTNAAGLPDCLSLDPNEPQVSLPQCVIEIERSPLDTQAGWPTAGSTAVPGQQFIYSSAGFVVAAMMVQVITEISQPGMSWIDYFDSVLVQPCAMTWSWNSTTDPMAGGGGITNTDSLMQLLDIQRTGGHPVPGHPLQLTDGTCTTTDPVTGLPTVHTILQGASVVAMRYDWTQAVAVWFSPRCDYSVTPVDCSQNVTYGLGLWRELTDANDSALVVSSPGAFGSYPWVDLANDYRAVLSTYITPNAPNQPEHCAINALKNDILTALGETPNTPVCP